MSQRARARANARPWESMSFGPEDDDDLEEGDEGEDEPIGDWSSDVRASANQTENA